MLLYLVLSKQNETTLGAANGNISLLKKTLKDSFDAGYELSKKDN